MANIDSVSADTAKTAMASPSTAVAATTPNLSMDDAFSGGFSGTFKNVFNAARFSGNKEEDPDDLLEEMYNNQYQTYEQYYQPLIASLESEVDSTELIEEAQARAATLNADSVAATQRAISRTGASMTPAQQAQMERSRRTNVSIGESTSVNAARKNQQVIREGATNDLMTTASALQAGSTDALAQVSANKNARDQAYENASSGFMSNVLGTAGAIGGFAIGGPGGAAIGGAAGSYIGGSI